MKTELDIVPHATTSGHKIQVQQYEVRNVHLHQILTALSRTVNSMLEADFANSNSGLSITEAISIRDDWVRINVEWQRALTHRGLPPTGGYEEQYFVLLATSNQILSMGNVRAQRVAAGLRNLAHRMMASGSAKSEYDIQPADERAVNLHIAYMNNVLDDYVGIISDTDYNRGLSIPAHTHLGTVVPPESLGRASSAEPSPEGLTNVSVPDVTDQESLVPAPTL